MKDEEIGLQMLIETHLNIDSIQYNLKRSAQNSRLFLFFHNQQWKNSKMVQLYIECGAQSGGRRAATKGKLEDAERA